MRAVRPAPGVRRCRAALIANLASNHLCERRPWTWQVLM
jgi:hypothetical protein